MIQCGFPEEPPFPAVPSEPVATAGVDEGAPGDCAHAIAIAIAASTPSRMGSLCFMLRLLAGAFQKTNRHGNRFDRPGWEGSDGPSRSEEHPAAKRDCADQVPL